MAKRSPQQQAVQRLEASREKLKDLAEKATSFAPSSETCSQSNPSSDRQGETWWEDDEYTYRKSVPYKGMTIIHQYPKHPSPEDEQRVVDALVWLLTSAAAHNRDPQATD